MKDPTEIKCMYQYTVATDRNRSYEVFSSQEIPLKRVWESERCLFSQGTKVTISDEKGRQAVFIKV